MNTGLIERARIELDAAPGKEGAIVQLSEASATRSSSVVDLAPSQRLELDGGSRHDLYLLRGSADLSGEPLARDDFVTHAGEALTLRAGPQGARVLVYREAGAAPRGTAIERAAQRQWLAGRHAHMQVVPLPSEGHRLSLVAWEPGARTRDHTHPQGEEIFVLSGTLRDGEERLTAGTWMRLHPGTHHEPFADQPAVILLRHGHLLAQPDQP